MKNNGKTEEEETAIRSESAVNAPTAAKGGNLALVYNSRKKDTSYATLFDRTKAEQLLSRTPGRLTPPEAISKSAVGFIKIGDHIRYMPISGREQKTDAKSVQLSAAEAGYGPLMYDIALGMAYPDYVTSDRASVSNAALAVWTHYFKNRPDVERELIMDPRKVEGPYIGYLFPHFCAGAVNKEMDELTKRIAAHEYSEPVDHYAIKKDREKLYVLAKKNPLCYKYRMRAPTSEEGPALETLIQRGNDFKKRMEVILADKTDRRRQKWDADRELRSAGGTFFNGKYLAEEEETGKGQ